ncbi:MAG: 3-hydroxyacyl-CoA dehydrogenase [Caldilineae bacterium]|nr:MAG: 3-hydroxyacyl-CoA dehydrogenase [Caldilineae bacterium]
MVIRFERTQDDIVVLTFDAPGRSVNLIDEALARALEESVTRLEEEPRPVGVVLASAKSSFVAGADLEMLLGLEDAAAAFAMAEALKRTLRRLETLGVPVVAALNGTALGGGWEVALACHYRIAVDDERVRFGLPEVTLGLLPGGGGVTRMTRMLGLQDAHPYLIEGKQVSPREALAAGLVDELVEDQAALLPRARAWIREHDEAAQPWDRPGYLLPGGSPNDPRNAGMVAVAPAMLRQKTFGNYPAPEAILSAMVEGAQVDFETASRIESRYFAEVATGRVAKNMITAFWFQLNEIKKGRSRPRDVPRRETKRLGVLGAGLMGHGIAYVSALAGMEVVLKDVSVELAEAGKARIDRLLQERVEKGRLTPDKKAEVLARIHTTGSASDMAGCDLVIEAVPENREIKAQVIAETEACLAPDAVFGSNTSTLPISGLAAYGQRPEQFVGIHFFSPVHRMRLVEIIRGRQTSDATLAKAFDYVQQIGKTPIVVNDSRGFYTSRVFMTYVNEGMAMLVEGQHPHRIEMAGRQAGMPVGPLAVSDEVNLGLAYHILEQARRDAEVEGREPPSHPGHEVLEKMVTVWKRTGKAQGAGFYEYPPEGRKYLWPQLCRLFPPRGHELTQAEMMERLMFVQALETARCYEEGVVTSVADANIGSIFGWGFAPFKGGTLQYINDYGVAAFVGRSRELARLYGARFEPPALLERMAAEGEVFL